MKNREERHPLFCPKCKEKSVFGNHYSTDDFLNWFCLCGYHWTTKKKYFPEPIQLDLFPELRGNK